MSNTFFLTVGIILAGIGLLLITAKILTYIRCTVPINATVVKLEIEYTFWFRNENLLQPKKSERNAIFRASVSFAVGIGVSFHRRCFDLVLFYLGSERFGHRRWTYYRINISAKRRKETRTSCFWSKSKTKRYEQYWNQKEINEEDQNGKQQILHRVRTKAERRSKVLPELRKRCTGGSIRKRAAKQHVYTELYTE